MAKTIKFNLICDEKPVRTIEDLQNNFSVEDVLAYYNNRLLHRWLRVRGYDSELEAVSSIVSEKPIDIIKDLIRIFNVVDDETKIEESIYMLEYLEERKKLNALYEQKNYNVTHIIDNYEAGYRKLVNGILETSNDIAKIKANISEITDNYAWILELDHRNLFYTLNRRSSILAIMCLLMNEKSRNYYLPVTNTNKDGTVTVDTEENYDKKKMYSLICNLITHSYFKDALYGNLFTFAGVTDGYWKDLEPKGKQYMIVSMGAGDYVRSAGQIGGDLSHEDITNRFVIVNGIDYKSNSNARQLLYMEV